MKRIVSIALVFLLAYAGVATAATDVPAKSPEVSAAAVALVDMESGQVLYAVNGDSHRPIASLTKIATALTAMDTLRPGDSITIKASAKAVSGGVSNLRAGDTITVADALAYVFLPSHNDVAIALGQAVAGEESAFVASMNAKARSLGLVDTAFVDSHGLASGLEHFSTAQDLAALSVQALRNKTIRSIASRGSYSVARPGKQELLKNRNVLVGTYPGAIGLKTGHTDAAGYCLVAAAKRGRSGYVAVVLGSPTRESSFDDARRLLDYAFANRRPRTLFRKGTVYSRRSIGGRVRPLLAGKTVGRMVWLPAGPIRRSVELNRRPAPGASAAGQVVGKLSAYQGDKLLATTPLVVGGRKPAKDSLIGGIWRWFGGFW